MIDGSESTRFTPPRDRRGFALIAVLIVMVVLGLIGSAALSLTAGDQKVTRLFADANQADAAATAGLEHAIAVYQTNGTFPLSGTINGYAYTVTLRRDSFNFDGVGGAGPVHLASNGTLNDSGNGNPVVILTSTATKGSYKAVQTMRVAKGTLSVDIDAALTANASITLTGNISVDGRNHTLGGSLIDGTNTANTGACAENKPAVVLTDSLDFVSAGGSSDLYCNPVYNVGNPPCVAKRPNIVYVSPEDVLGLHPGDLDALIVEGDDYVAPDTIGGLVYVDGDYGSGAAGGNNVSGTGILIVHNPLYNPREHDPLDPSYNAAKASNPAVYGPRNLGNINGGTFRGLIIADKIDKINGNIGIFGAVVSLSEIDVTKVGAGTADIKYSCAALQAAGGSFPVPPTRLSWAAD
ncbi:MAG TPA: prepilin-type N-terminal cleavage/methylation domain-containing protein [Gemmatimonadota bacterium]|jgi:Tfp pilus assembly protein PilX